MHSELWQMPSLGLVLLNENMLKTALGSWNQQNKQNPHTNNNVHFNIMDIMNIMAYYVSSQLPGLKLPREINPPPLNENRNKRTKLWSKIFEVVFCRYQPLFQMLPHPCLCLSASLQGTGVRLVSIYNVGPRLAYKTKKHAEHEFYPYPEENTEQEKTSKKGLKCNFWWNYCAIFDKSFFTRSAR